MTPLLFTVWERLDRERFTSVLRTVAVISFRYSVVSGLNPNALESVYHLAAKAVHDGVAQTSAAIFERIRSLYVDDDKFREDFARFAVSTGGQRKKVAKYILSRLETDASSHAVDPDTDPGSIEPILPENPAEPWDVMFSRERWDASVYRLGNLTLLEPPQNRVLGNEAYAAKVAAYVNSRYTLTREITTIAPQEWTPALLDERQRQMAQRAMHIWRVDFA